VQGTNRDADVRKVQKLLNTFPASEGDPAPKLEVDGIAGPKTNAAIVQFQKVHFPWWTVFDGRAEPGKATIVELTINESDATMGRQGIILNAVHQWNRQMSGVVRWVRGTLHDPNYVVFHNGNQGSHSDGLGMKGGAQEVEIDFDGAARLVTSFGGSIQGVVVHEMGHATGLGHEHQRRDRNQFVEIVSANVIRPCDFRLPRAQ
jgi:hypothetical protein